MPKTKKICGSSDGKTKKAISQWPMLLDFASQNLVATLGPSFLFCLRPTDFFCFRQKLVYLYTNLMR